MNDALIDSAVIVDVLRGHTVAEVLEGARNAREQAALRNFFTGFEVVPANEADSLFSIELLAGFRLSHGVGWPDCLIAATALRLGRPVATTHLKHFAPLPNLQVVRPY